MKFFNSETTLGLDIREESVAMTLLVKNQQTPEIIASHFFKIPKLGALPGEADEVVFHEVDKFLKTIKTVPDNAALSLPRKFVTLKSFELPSGDRETLDAMIEFELERHFSGPLEDLNFSYATTRKSDTHYQVTAVAIKKETTRRFVDLFQRLGLNTAILDVSIFSNLNLLFSNGSKKGEVTVVVDVCSNSFEITVLNDNVVEISRSVLINCGRFQEHYFEPHDSETHYEMHCLDLSEEILEEIKTTLGACRNIREDETVEEIFLLGGGNYSASLAKQIGKMSEVPTITISPGFLIKRDLPAQLDPTFMLTSLSLASRELRTGFFEINLLPMDPKAKNKRSPEKTTYSLLLLTVFLLMAFFVSQVIHNRMSLASLDNQLRKVKSQAASLEKIDLDYGSTEALAQNLKAIQKKNPLKLPALQELSKVLPKDTWLVSISIFQDQLEINGFSTSASKLVPLMERSPWFKNARFMGSIVNGKDGEKFTIQTELTGG